MKKSIQTICLVCTVLAALFLFSTCDHGNNSTPETPKYEVIFQSNGGSPVETQKVKKGKTATKPEDPVKENPTDKEPYFDAWYIDQEFTQEFDFSTPITQTTVLWARWLEIPRGHFRVTFDSQNGAQIESQIVKDGQTATQPTGQLTRQEYAFAYWYATDPDTPFDFASTPITQNLMLTAKWNRSGIYEATFEEDSLFCMNIYASLSADETSGVW